MRQAGELMGFLAPWFLGGLAALGVPVFVHLLRRHISMPRPVSSLMFFERGTQSSTRHRRLRYLLLFALRFALLLLVVLAFANPFVRRAAADANGRTASDCAGQLVQHAGRDAALRTPNSRRLRCWRQSRTRRRRRSWLSAGNSKC